MYCRNCGNEVHDKAIACPKCGVNPRSEKKFCPSCGAATNHNQIACTSCGVALASQPFAFDTSSIPKIDAQVFITNKSVLFASIALLSCFFPWIKITFMVVQNLNFFNISKLADMVPNSILVSFVLYLFPICLLGIVAAEFVPQISKYKKHLSIGSVVLLAYIIIGLYLTVNYSPPKTEHNDMFSGMMDTATKAIREMVSVGFGLYLCIAATIASFVFAKKQW